MKRNTKIFLILSLIILISISCFSIIALKSKRENHQQANFSEGENNPKVALLNDVQKNQEDNNTNVEKTNQYEELINISECSEEFMEEYFEEVKQIEDKENVLIVSSKEKIENTYGASDIIEAPNNQYILQYNSEEEKNKALEEFENSKEILYVDENHTYTLFESEYNSWGIEAMGLDSAIQTAEESSEGTLKEVTVAIIDSGCDMELFDASYKGKIKETYNLYDSYEMYDSHGHGTHIAGTIAEGTSSNVDILPIKVSDSKSMNSLTILNAVNYVTYYKKADVINMSFGGTTFDNSLYVAIEAALDNGIISVAAAGNESTSQNSYPAAYDNTISVSAVDSEYNLAEFSNYGEMVTFSAPGVGIQSINGSMSGTSMATPHIVCAVAMLKGANRSLTLEQTTKLLKNTAIDLGDAGWDQYYGYGFIDLSNFDDLIEETQNTNIVDFRIEQTEFDAIYGNITNLMGFKMIFKDANGNEYSRYFSEIDGLEIENYDAFAAGEQEIKIKYKNFEKIITVNNGNSGGTTYAYTGYYADETQTTICVGDVFMREGVKKIYIPAYIDGLKVVGIYEGAFENKDINAVILPSTITSIGEAAFANSTVKSITGGAGEVSLSDNVFYNAYKLETFEPEISSLGDGTFYNASSINNLTLSDDIEKIGTYTFCNCVSLENINIPNKLIEIGEYALSNTNIIKLDIPKTLVTISESALAGMLGLETITVDSENPIYDSRGNCNALIETSSNTIKLGSSSIVIPDTVTTIGAYAFFYNNKLESVNTNKVQKINDYAFYGCSNLREIYLTETVTTLGYYALRNLPKLTVYTYDQNLLTDLMNNQGVDKAICIAPKTVEVSASEKYTAFDKADDIIINISYYGFGPAGCLEETITEGYTIIYANDGECFKKGDTYFTVSATTQYGIDIEETVDVTIEKAIPVYTVPTDITAQIGTKLSDVELPEGFEWMNSTQILQGPGIQTCYARFLPTDTENYEIVENIEIIIQVGAIKPQSITLDKTNLVFNILEKQTLTATILPKDATNKNVIWKSTNPNIAEVNELGEVQPINDGTCEIICSSVANPKVQARCTVVVDNTLQTTINKTYNKDNTVTVSVESKYPFEDTKPTWDLSDNKMIYNKTYNSNGTYSTEFKDTYGHTKKLTFTINEIVSKYNVSKIYDANTNTVTVNVTNNFGIQATKPTWMLSTDAKVYTKKYSTNGTYTTKFVDIEGSEKSVEFVINQIDDKAPELNVKQVYNEETNTVTVNVTSNEILGQTKPTWTLSEDKITYSKIYNLNGTYTTTFKDIYGNERKLTFTINEIDDIAPTLTIDMAYDAETNTVTVSVTSNEILGKTKPTWTLSEDKITYSKIYNLNGTYTTTFKDIYGNEKKLTFTIDKIQSKYEIVTTYDATTNKTTVSITNNYGMQATKPTWKLSEDKRVYTKVYSASGTYTTKFVDIDGVETSLTFTI